MTRHEVVLLPQAEAEIREAYSWYRQRSVLAASAFRDEVIDAIDDLGAQPNIWPADDEGVRRCILRRFPYAIHYAMEGKTVTVLAVAHQRRKPGYWRGR